MISYVSSIGALSAVTTIETRNEKSGKFSMRIFLFLEFLDEENHWTVF